MRPCARIAIGALLTILAATAASATPGDLDSSFGTDGIVLTDIPTGNVGRWYSVAVQSDGRIVVAGYVVEAHNADFLVARYNSDGSLDTSFGEFGIVTTDLGGTAERAHAITIQPDGKIVVAGYTQAGANEDFAIVRYDEYGNEDYTFGDNGRVITPVGPSTDRAVSVAVQSDGKIVVGGYSSDNRGFTDFTLVRYNIDGNIDSSFDGDGKVFTTIGDDDILTSVGIQADGKIVAVGNSRIRWGRWTGSLVRYNANGSTDTSFDDDGALTISLGDAQIDAASLAIQGDGRIVVAGGISYSTGGSDFAVLRYNEDGSLDVSFDDDGVATTAVGDWDSGAVSVVIQSDGRIVVAGRASTIGSTDFAVVRYEPNGTLDLAFDGDGKLTTDFGGSSDIAEAAAFQSDGKLLVVGLAAYGRYTVVRYESDGEVDSGFGDDGVVTTRLVTTEDSIADLAIQADGKIVAVGVAGERYGYGSDFVAIRYNTDGSLDTGFSDRGYAALSFFGTLGATATAVAIQHDARIVVAGYALSGSDDNFQHDVVVARFNSNGSVDASFGLDGNVTTDLGGTVSIPSRMVLQSDGRLVVVGTTGDDDRDIFIARYNSDGTPDPHFGNNGIVTADFGSRFDDAVDVVIQPNGKIIAVVDSPAGDIDDFIVARYNPEGSADQLFGNNGIVTTDFFTMGDRAHALALQSDGKIVVVGKSRYVEDHDFVEGCYYGCAALARYNTDGSLDTTFGEGGRAISAFGDSGPRRVAIQADDKIVVAGSNRSESEWDEGFLVARYDPDGSPDSSFNMGYPPATFWPFNMYATALALQADGRIVVGGQYSNQTSVDFVLARYIATDCGNGVVDNDGLEECDDGGETVFCDSNCTFASCGDGHVNAAALEQCDNGNDLSGDGCSSDCQLEFCGDGVVNNAQDGIPTEACDDPAGNGTAPDQCRPDCQQATCSDGIVDTGEACDEAGETVTCDDDCTAVACGDGNRNQSANEECDDGNAANGDGCSSLCELQQLCGDVNDDGRRTASDAVLILKAAIGIDVVCPTWICDVDGQSGPKATDALTVLSLSVGLPATVQCGEITALVLRLVDPVVVAGLNATFDLSDIAGALVGAGSAVECENLIQGVTAVFNRPDVATLRIGYVSLDGIQGPVSLARCAFTAIRDVRSSDFGVAVEDAVDLSDNPIVPPPTIDAIPY